MKQQERSESSRQNAFEAAILPFSGVRESQSCSRWTASTDFEVKVIARPWSSALCGAPRILSNYAILPAPPRRRESYDNLDRKPGWRDRSSLSVQAQIQLELVVAGEASFSPCPGSARKVASLGRHEVLSGPGEIAGLQLVTASRRTSSQAESAFNHDLNTQQDGSSNDQDRPNSDGDDGEGA